jgi:ribosomal protein S18 acetylase RimI-like enzyme
MLERFRNRSRTDVNTFSCFFSPRILCLAILDQAAVIVKPLQQWTHSNREPLYTAGMYQIRAATPADAAVITHHRRRMFVDAGRQDNRILDVMAEHFHPWVETRLADGRYKGWLTSEGGKVIAGAGLIVLDWPPHPLDPRQDKRGYLLNVYVEPEHRRKRLASQLIDQALAEARKQKIRVVALHSTDAGQPLYESNGFRRTNEMFYVEPVEG